MTQKNATIETGISAIHEMLSERLIRSQQYGKADDWSLQDLVRAYEILSKERPTADLILMLNVDLIYFLDHEFDCTEEVGSEISRFLRKFTEKNKNEFIRREGTRSEGIIIQNMLTQADKKAMSQRPG